MSSKIFLKFSILILVFILVGIYFFSNGEQEEQGESEKQFTELNKFGQLISDTELMLAIQQLKLSPNDTKLGANVFVSGIGFVAAHSDTELGNCLASAITLSGRSAATYYELASKGIPVVGMGLGLIVLDGQRLKALSEHGFGDEFKKANDRFSEYHGHFSKLILGENGSFKSGILGSWFSCV